MTLISSLLAISVLAIDLLAASHALLTKRDPKSALAWVTACLFLPLLGAITYSLFGINRVTRSARRLYLGKASVDEEHEYSNDSASFARPQSIVGFNLTGLPLAAYDRLELLRNGEETFPRMLDAIDAAQHSVHLCTYIFQDDATGIAFVSSLAAAQRRGVDVKVIVDGLGAVLYPPRITQRLREHGVNFKFFDPLRLYPPQVHINMRNHRKLLIVDGEIAFTGGHNLSDRHLVDKVDNPKKAADLHFLFQGEAAKQFEFCFQRDWNHCTAVDEEPPKPQLPSADRRLRNGARLILDGPNENLDKLNELLLGMFAVAKQRLWVMTPYFLPNNDLVGALIAAQLRGVDVRVIAPERTNIHLAHWAAMHSLTHLVPRRLPIYLQPAPFNHTKAIIVDTDYSLVGSANLDARSLRLNYEIGVEVYDEALNAQLSAYFEEVLSKSKRATSELLISRPAWERLRNAVAWLFTPYL